MQALVAHITSTPEWEVKCSMCLHQWYRAEHAEMLRRRISEMRHPAPPLDKAPDAALDAFLEELLRPENTEELLVGIYRVALFPVRDSYRTHIARTNPLVDQPMMRLSDAPRFLDLKFYEKNHRSEVTGAEATGAR